jgi:hypothetical protein
LISSGEYLTELVRFKSNPYYSQEMHDYCEEYAFYIKELRHKLKETCPDTFVELEVTLDLSKFIPEGFGTADCIIVAEPVMHVIDFKYGKGVKVEAEGNTQMEIYALGALELYKDLYDITDVQMTIIQPRLGGISHGHMEKEALNAFATTLVIPLAKEAYEGPGKFYPGEDICRFCKATRDCKARAKYYVKLFEENPVLKDDGVISAEEAGELLAKAAGMTKWLEAIEDKVKDSLMQGEPVPGWKLVEGRSTRQYKDEEAVAQILKTKGKLKAGEIYTKKLITITNLEKLIGKKKCSELLSDQIIKPEGKPTLAPADDKRPEIFPAKELVDAFDE